MPSTDVTEPKVSVHGIPQSQYEQQYSSQVAQPNVAPPGSGGILASMEQHKGVWAVVIGVATIVVIIIIYRLQQSQAGGTSTDSSGNLSGSGQSGSSVDLSGIEAEYNQLISLQNQNNGTLASILAAIQKAGTGGSSDGGGDNTGGDGTGTPGPPNIDPGYGEYGIPTGVNTNDIRKWTPQSTSSALNSLHWDTNEGVPIYDQPNSLGSVIKTIPFGQSLTTTAAWTATGPLEYSTGTTWAAVQGGGYVPVWSLIPEAIPTTQQGRQTIFPTIGSVPSTPTGGILNTKTYTGGSIE